MKPNEAKAVSDALAENQRLKDELEGLQGLARETLDKLDGEDANPQCLEYRLAQAVVFRKFRSKGV